MSSDFGDPKLWNAEAIADKVRNIVAAKTNCPVVADSTFDSLGLDSLAMAEVIFEIESAFGIHADERLLDLRSIGDVIAFVVQEVSREQAARGRAGRTTSAEFRPG
jgi:acyl carrier protein